MLAARYQPEHVQHKLQIFLLCCHISLHSEFEPTQQAAATESRAVSEVDEGNSLND